MMRLVALACAFVALAGGVADARAVSFGVTEDAVKAHPDRLQSQLAELGMSENTISVLWNPDNPTALPPDVAAIDNLVRVAAQHRIRMSFAIYQHRPVGLSSATSPILMAQFSTWLQAMARRYPAVKEYIAPNEPNQPRFWRPQFDNQCVNISGGVYARVMATMYDALKSVNTQIEVAGAALSPRGNDNCLAVNNVSTSPVRFIKYLGVEYRAMKRNRPLMDSFSFHPYPRINTDDPMTGYRWPNIGVANFDRLKQALHDAFEGTAQPTVEEGLKIRIHESGHETKTEGVAGYKGREEVPPVDEPTQARYYVKLIRYFACDPAVDSINFFHLIDEDDRAGLQSGLLRVDGARKPSFEAVKAAIAEARSKGCTGNPVRWAPSEAVTGANVEFGALGVGAPSVRINVEEDVSYSAGIFLAAGATTDDGRDAITRSLASARKPVAALSTSRGEAKAYYKLRIRTSARKLAPGTYVYALRLRAWANPDRTSVFVSSPFELGWSVKNR
jgi:hypothetical protein